MQASAFFLFAICFQVTAATSLSQTVTYSGKDVSLRSVLASVKQQTGYGIFYEGGEEMLRTTAPITVDAKNQPLDQFLRVALHDQPLDYSVEGTTIFIRRKAPISASAAPPTPLAEIKGRITNDKGEPLVNANITVKRTGHGTVTDANGNFTLRNVNSDDIITISFIGYKTQSASLTNRTTLNLIMEPATNDLDKVVVQAYGTTSQRLATGNIGVVRAEDIAKQPITNVLQVIQGQVPGAVVTNTTGNASSTIKMEIRGRTSINPDFPSDPLYIIDGVPLTVIDNTGASNYAAGSMGMIVSGMSSPANGQSPFFNINPSDIESIEILKDADATAIYGSRGANGVVLVNTKKGRIGKSKVEINAYSGFSDITTRYRFLNTKQYVQMRREALANDNLAVDVINAPDLAVWDTTRYTDWQKYLWEGTGKTSDVEASISGGDVNTIFRIAGGYHHVTDIMTVTGANNRSSVSFNLQHKTPDQKFTISLAAIYSYSNINLISVPNAALLPPNAPAVFDNKGNLNYNGWAPIQSAFSFSVLKQPYTSSTNLLNANAVLSYSIVKGLVARASLGYNNGQNNQTNFQPITSQNPNLSPTGAASFGTSNFHNIIIEPQLEYNGQIGPGALNVLLGGSSQLNKTDGFLANGIGYTNDLLLTSINNAPTKIPLANNVQYKYAAIFGRINYNIANKYIVNFNGRRDGSSRFGPGRQFGDFWSVGGAWIFSEEKWLKRSQKFLSFGKIRASYGTTGSDQIGDYSFLTRWYPIAGTYNNVLPYAPLGHTDSLLHWEVNKKLEFGVSIGFLNDRLMLEASWYRNRCNDQLVQYPTPGFTGFTDVTANFPANVQNKGIELILTTRNIENSTFKWQSKLNIAFNRNKLISFPHIDQSPYAGLYVVGQSLNIRKVFHKTGVDPQTGLYTFEDKDHDGQITIDYSGHPDDRYYLDVSPKFDGGFSNTFTYKNFSLSALMYFRKQIGRNAVAIQLPGRRYNVPYEVLQSHWQKPGDIATYAKFTSRPTDQSYTFFQQFSDGVYTDASFIRLQNVSVSCNANPKLASKAGMNGLSVYVQMQNVFVLTKYKGVDPELQNFGALPLPRIITVGLSCKF